MARVSLKNVTKTFGKTAAVKELNLDIQDQEFLVLLGPSGCGKTTALRCIAGLESPDSGEVYIGDKKVNELPPKDRDIAMVFQSYALYPHMTVFNNLAFPLQIRKMPKKDVTARVQKAAELLRIGHLLDRKPRQLSGGEAQRVALGRAIVREPKVFLMDEPLSNLDAKLRLYMRGELKRLQKELKITTIYVTHDQAEAMTMADRIAVMNAGALQQVDDPDSMYMRPKNLFVAGFVGSPPMNFIPCKFEESGSSVILRSTTFGITLPEEMSARVKKNATSKEVILGARPENIRVMENKSGENCVPTEVYVAEPLGSEVILSLKVDDSVILVKCPPHFKYDIGHKVWIEFDLNYCRIFDKATEKTISLS